jgi:hypothetical protein
LPAGEAIDRELCHFQSAFGNWQSALTRFSKPEGLKFQRSKHFATLEESGGAFA